MIAGIVNASLEPIVQIGLVGEGARTVITAVVDTGFSGDLCLSREHIGAMDLEFLYVKRYELADGSIVAKDKCNSSRTADDADGFQLSASSAANSSSTTG